MSSRSKTCAPSKKKAQVMDKKRLTDDWDVDDLIPPPKSRHTSDSDESFELSSNTEEDSDSEEESSESDYLVKNNTRNQYSFGQPKIRVHLPLLLPPTPTLPKSPPWVALTRMKPSPKLTLAQKRVKFQYVTGPSSSSWSNRPKRMKRGPYKKTLSKLNSNTCPHCGVVVRDKYKLNRHMVRMHVKVGSESLIQCPYCSTSWRKVVPLNKHIRAVHPGKKGHPANRSSARDEVASLGTRNTRQGTRRDRDGKKV